MSNQKYVGGGVWRSVSKPINYAFQRKTVQKQEEKPLARTVLGVEVDKKTYDRYSERTWNINGKSYDLLGVMLWTTSKEIATAYPEDSAEARKAFAEILNELDTINPEGVAAARSKLNNTIFEITGEKVMKHKNFGGYLEELKAVYESNRGRREALEKRYKEDRAVYEEIIKTSTGVDALIAQGKLAESEQTYAKNVEELKRKHNEDVNNIRKTMLEHLTEFYRADPSKIDDKAMQFVNSGVATPAELEHLAEQYKANPTMLRMIGMHASKIADNYKRDNTSVGREKYLTLRRLSEEAEGLTMDVSASDEIAIFNGLAAFAERGVCREEYQTAGFASKWDEIYAEADGEMKAVDRLT